MSLASQLPQMTQAIEGHEQRRQALLERIECELRFAELLCTLRPAEAPTWRPLLDRARQLVSASDGREADLGAAVAAAEAVLAPVGAAAKTLVVHAIGHAHIDMNWMWGWPETVGVVVDTMSTVLKLLDEFPTFHFTQSQAAIYRILEEHAPELIERIRPHVASGRWEVAASHWVEGDKNLAGGESLCRQVLYAKRYLHRLLGLDPADLCIDWAPDTFGHPGTMPLYLSQAGIPYTFLHRPGAHAEGWPQAFRWQGPAGSSTLVFNGMRGGYNGVFCPRMILDRITSWFTDTQLHFAPYLFGVGDHGGGPTRRDLLRCAEISTWPIFPRIVPGPARAFFDQLARSEASLPTITGELNFVFSGCYTSQSLLKKANRQGENRIDDAERAATLAQVAVGRAYPAARLEEAWRNVLFSQFHDILPGSCVHDARTFSHGLFQQSLAIASQCSTHSLRALAATIATDHAGPTSLVPLVAAFERSGFSGGAGLGAVQGGPSLADHGSAGSDRQFVIFNLQPGRREEVIEATIWENARDYANLPFHRQSFTVLAPGGQPAATQILEQGTWFGHDFVRLALPVAVAELGYTALTLRAEPAPAAVKPGAVQLGRDDWPARYSFHDLTQEGLENELLRLELDPRTGGIRRLTCRTSGRDLIRQSSAAPLLEAGIERNHGMSSWVIDHDQERPPVICTGMKRVAKGPLVSSIELTYTMLGSEAVVVCELRHGDPRLHLRLRLTWREIGNAQRGVPGLRLVIPTAMNGSQLTCEVPFGAAEREFTAGEEVPGQQWALLRGQIDGHQHGLLLLNDGRYGHALQDGSLRLNVIRSTYDPDPLPEIGQHELAVALLPCAGDLTVAEAMRHGEHFNHPLAVIGTDHHSGKKPGLGQLLHLAPATIRLLTHKVAEDHVGSTVVRLLNPERLPAQVRIAPGAALGRRLASGCLLDVLEQPLPGTNTLAPTADGSLELTLAGGAFCTLRLTWATA